MNIREDLGGTAQAQFCNLAVMKAQKEQKEFACTHKGTKDRVIAMIVPNIYPGGYTKFEAVADFIGSRDMYVYVIRNCAVAEKDTTTAYKIGVYKHEYKRRKKPTYELFGGKMLIKTKGGVVRVISAKEFKTHYELQVKKKKEVKPKVEVKEVINGTTTN